MSTKAQREESLSAIAEGFLEYHDMATLYVGA